MFNPWVLLAAVGFWIASCWAAYELGGDHRQDAIVARTKVEQDKLIAQAQADAQADTATALAAERKRALGEQAAIKRRHALEIDIERKGAQRATRIVEVGGNADAFSCDLDAVSYGLLVNAVRDANAFAASGAPSVPAGVPADSGARGRAGGDGEKVD